MKKRDGGKEGERVNARRGEAIIKMKKAQERYKKEDNSKKKKLIIVFSLRKLKCI